MIARLISIAALLVFAAPAQAQLAGRWAGVGRQIGPGPTTSAWTIALDLASDGDSRIDYPSIPCSAVLHERRRGKDFIEFEEKLVSGLCYDHGLLVVRLTGKRLSWYWRDRDGAATASALLHRVEDLVG